MGLSRGLLRCRSLSNIEMNNAIQTKGHAMRKVYIGIDAHKETNSMASAFAGRDKPETIGKYSADLDRFLAGLRKFQKKT